MVMKQYVICQEKTTQIFTIRMNTDCSPARFNIIADFDTFEEADNYLHNFLYDLCD